MKKHTFTPGTRVRDTGKNITGTVADDPAMVTEYPGMIPVHWDNGDNTVASPSILAPAVGLGAFTEDQLRAELKRREDEAYEAQRTAANEYVRTHPDAVHRNVGIGELADLADAEGLSVLALSAIWFETYGKKATK